MPAGTRPTTASARTPERADAVRPSSGAGASAVRPSSGAGASHYGAPQPLKVASAKVRLGTSSWTDPTLTKSSFYSKKSLSAEDRLREYSSRFSIVEVDSTYYRLPSERNSELWAERTPNGFVFDVKAFGLLTGHAVDAAAVPDDLRDEVAADHRDKKRAYLDHLTPEGQAEMWRRFLEPLEPLRKAKKLGCLFFQFPTWFPKTDENMEYVASCVAAVGKDRIAVEFRQGSWMKPKRAEHTLRFLESIGAAYTCVDEPLGFPSSIPPVAAATTPLAVVRFHGRNAENWNKKVSTAAERFQYDYPDEELEEWVPSIESLAEQAKEVHVLFNNCYSDYGVRNAASLAALLGEDWPALPAPP